MKFVTSIDSYEKFYFFRNNKWSAAFLHGIVSGCLTFCCSIVAVVAYFIYKRVSSRHESAPISDVESPAECGDQDLQNYRDALELNSITPTDPLDPVTPTSNVQPTSNVSEEAAATTIPTQDEDARINIDEAATAAATPEEAVATVQDDLKVEINPQPDNQRVGSQSPTAPPPPYVQATNRDPRVSFDLSYSSTYLNRTPSSHSMRNWEDLPCQSDPEHAFSNPTGARARRRTLPSTSSTSGRRRKTAKKRRRTQYIDPSLFLDNELFTDARSNVEQRSSDDDNACR